MSSSCRTTQPIFVILFQTDPILQLSLETDPFLRISLFIIIGIQWF